MGLFDLVSNQVLGQIAGQVKKRIPSNAIAGLQTAGNVLGKVASGNLLGAASALINSRFIRDKFPIGADLASQAEYWLTPTPVFGGIAPVDAQELYGYVRDLDLAKKNLFLIEISDLTPTASVWLDGPTYLGTDGPRAFNIFATDVSYTPVSVSGEKHRVGGATTDGVNSFDPTDLRITTMDDTVGTIKEWYRWKARQAVNWDGTVGVPADYLVRIRILHAFITNGSNVLGYEDTYLMRPATAEVELSRRDNNIQEMHLNFSQFDTFLPP